MSRRQWGAPVSDGHNISIKSSHLSLPLPPLSCTLLRAAAPCPRLALYAAPLTNQHPARSLAHFPTPCLPLHPLTIHHAPSTAHHLPQAEELIKRRLEVTPDEPRLWCALGDLCLDDAHYLQAWERSGHRNAR